MNAAADGHEDGASRQGSTNSPPEPTVRTAWRNIDGSDSFTTTPWAPMPNTTRSAALLARLITMITGSLGAATDKCSGDSHAVRAPDLHAHHGYVGGKCVRPRRTPPLRSRSPPRRSDQVLTREPNAVPREARGPRRPPRCS